MIKFVIMFRQPDDLDPFENAYQDLLALVERMPNLKRRQAVLTLGNPQGVPLYYRTLELYFDDQQQFRESFMSQIGQEAGQELARFPKGSYELFFGEVYEE
jgi:uncharacterized protein (TIGR02118 family)